MGPYKVTATRLTWELSLGEDDKDDFLWSLERDLSNTRSSGHHSTGVFERSEYVQAYLLTQLSRFRRSDDIQLLNDKVIALHRSRAVIFYFFAPDLP
jgi:hypothetical protein